LAQTASPPPAAEEAQLPVAPPPDGDAAGTGVLRAGGAIGFVTPAMVLIGVFLVFPAVWTLYLGLTDYRLTGLAAAEPQFAGADNYMAALEDPSFYNALRVTLVFVLGSAVLGQAVLGFALAWMFRDWRGPWRTAIELLVILAWIIPSSVVAFLWVAFLDGRSGTLNALLGIDTEWLLDFPLLSIIVFNIWRGTAFSMLLFGAALNSLPPSHLETARLAGATGWQQLRDIVLPSVRGYALTNLLLISLWTFNDFTPFLLTGGGPSGATETLPIYIYREALSLFEFGYGSAISAIMLVINLVLALFYLRLMRRTA
jgi:multiple sugar transport system permease protein